MRLPEFLENNLISFSVVNPDMNLYTSYDGPEQWRKCFS